MSGSLFAAAVSSFVTAETVRVPVVPPSSVQTLLRFAVFRGVTRDFQQRVPSSLLASSLCCLDRSSLLRFHYGTHLASAAGLSRANVVALVVLFVGKCMLPGDRHHSLQRPTAGRLPRRYRLASLPLLPSVRTPLSRPPPSRQK